MKNEALEDLWRLLIAAYYRQEGITYNQVVQASALLEDVFDLVRELELEAELQYEKGYDKGYELGTRAGMA